eukprot:SM000101S09233  [mRNA]  locus=s101:66158:69988:+ [translate_table: standard]
MEELQAEAAEKERLEALKARMAAVGSAVLADPEGQLPALRELQAMAAGAEGAAAVSFAMLSLAAIFKDIIPGYRIRLPTEKEVAMPVSKDVRKVRDYEAALLRVYQEYVRLLIGAAKAATRRRSALVCMAALLKAKPHFNHADALLAAIVPRMDSADSWCSSACCAAICEVLSAEGDIAVRAAQLVADLVRQRRCRLRPEVIQVFCVLKFDEDLNKAEGPRPLAGREATSDQPGSAHSLALQSKRQRKVEKRRLASKLHKKVEADFREAHGAASAAERRQYQSLMLAAVFETYIRVLKDSLLPESSGPQADGSGAAKLGPRPLLAATLHGLTRFSHLVSVDFMADLLEVLRKLSAGRDEVEGKAGDGSAALPGSLLTVAEQLGCCIVAFKIVQSNLGALNIDLRDFYVRLYVLLLDAPQHDVASGVLAEAMQVLLCEGRHQDMQRCAAFARRLGTAALHMPTAAAMATLVALRQLLVRNRKCLVLLEEAGGDGGPHSSVGTTEWAAEPEMSGALSSVAWELLLLMQHYHPAVAKLAQDIAKMAAASSDAFLQVQMSPQAALEMYSTSAGGFRPAIQPPGKRLSSAVLAATATRQLASPELVAIASHYKLTRAADGDGAACAPTGMEEETLLLGTYLESVSDRMRQLFRQSRNFREHAELHQECWRLARLLRLFQRHLSSGAGVP